MPKTLTQKQIVAIQIHARRAFDTLPQGELDALADEIVREREADDPFACAALVKKSALFSRFRHRETAEMMRRRGKRPVESAKELTQDDYLAAVAHFVRFYDSNEAAELSARSENEERKRLLWVLRKNCEERGLKFPEYPDAILKNQYDHTTETATVAELRKSIFTIRNRRKPSSSK